jgi:hypothetical protein
VIQVGEIIGSLLEGGALAFGVMLGVIATFDGLTGCAGAYTRAQRSGRRDGVIGVGFVVLLTGPGHTFFAFGVMLGGILAMRALQGLYKEIPQPTLMSARRTQ